MDSNAKSDEKAEVLRNEGNQLYKQGLFEESLMKYNESLCFASSSESRATIFANRSAVYFEAKHFPQCLNNIALARKHGYPTEKTLMLNAREKRCLKIMKDKRTGLPDPFDFFKLSYEANEKIPFIIDGLEVKTTAKFGRGIYTSRELKVGDFISVEPFFFKYFVLDPNYQNGNPANKFQFCQFCFNGNLLDLIPCGSCNATMYCGENCKSSDHLEHQFKCEVARKIQTPGRDNMVIGAFFKALSIAGGSVIELKKIYEECKGNDSTVFDFDFSNPEDPEYFKNQLRAALCLVKDKTVIAYNFNTELFTTHSLLKELWANHKEFISEFLFYLYTTLRCTTTLINKCKGIKGDHGVVGSASFLLGALINHSCVPNVRRYNVNGKQCLMVTRPIKKDEQIFDFYAPDFSLLPKLERQKWLLPYGFVCDCEACKNPLRYPTNDALKLCYNAKDFKFARRFMKDYQKIQREEIIADVGMMKKELQKLYSPQRYPSQEFSHFIRFFGSCVNLLSRNHY